MGAPFRLLCTENWPTKPQRLLLRAALRDGEEARRAWSDWRADHDLQALDHPSFYVLPTLFKNLRRLGVESPDLQTLRSTTRYAWCKNQLAVRSILEVIRLLEGAGIRTILLKGAPLTLFYYRDFDTRLMNDIDLLISEEDLPAAAKLLQDSEWRPSWPLPPDDLIPFMHSQVYTHSRWLELDLHWRPFTIDCPLQAEESFRSRVLERDVHGQQVRMPDPTDLLLMTCFHSRKGDVYNHGSCRWVLDAVRLLEGADPPIDWGALVERAQDLGLLPAVRDALTFLRQEFGADVPDAVLERAWAVPTTPEERRRYEWIVAKFHLGALSLRWRLAYNWALFAGVRRRNGQRAGILGFVRHLMTFHHWYHGLRHRWHAPFAALARALSRWASVNDGGHEPVGPPLG
jgi:Uncharacterised nucleotidyltransferase